MAFRKDTAHPERATLGIDIGSQSTRASLGVTNNYLCPRDGDVKINRQEIALRPKATSDRDLPDFSSLCNLIGDGEPYVGYNDPKGEATTTIKLALMLLTDAKDDGLQDGLTKILARIVVQGGGAVQKAKARAAEAVKSLLGHIMALAKDTCDKKRLYIDHIAFSIPAQWHIPSENMLGALVRQSFGLIHRPTLRIDCLFEVDAWARFYLDRLIMSQMTELEEHFAKYDSFYILFVDFGGFSLNTCIYRVFKRKQNNGVYDIVHVVVEDAAGVTGGSGHWNYNFRQFCKARGITNEQTLDELEIMFEQKKKWMTGTQDVVIYTETDSVTVRAAEQKPMYMKSCEVALKHFDAAVGRLKKFGAQSSLILASGGTSHAFFTQEEFTKSVTDHNMPESSLILTHEVDEQDSTLRIAKGLNYAMARMISVNKYIQEGGGWALQLANNESGMDWAPRAAILLGPDNVNNSVNSNQQHRNERESHPRRARFRMKQGFLLKERVCRQGTYSTQVNVVGFPFTMDASTENGQSYTDIGERSPAYNTVKLGAFGPGQYTISLEYEDDGDEGKLTVEVCMEANKTLGNEHVIASFSLQVYYYVSSGVALCRDSIEEIAEKVAILRSQLWGDHD